MRFGIRQSELAALIEYDQTYISALEVGLKGPPPADFVERIIAALSLSELEQQEMRAAAAASQRKIVIDRDTPQEVYWMLAALRERLPHLHPAQIRMIREIVDFPDTLGQRKPATITRLKRRKNEEGEM